MTTDALAMLNDLPLRATTNRRAASKVSTGCKPEKGLKEMAIIEETATRMPPTLFHWTTPQAQDRVPMMFFEQEKAVLEKQ
ncbi:hypothetical protein EDD85DRAFT_955097 [Armillaria nabsnona]|nr:hypothetical protein EDD85DRAFT_955097 [Armillaria nabsnona]